MLRTLIVSLLLTAVSAEFGFASFAETENPPCYVCGDGGVSTVTKPDVVIPLPAFVGIPSVTCGQLQAAGEDKKLIPSLGCVLLAQKQAALGKECGCAETVKADEATETPTTAPSATPSTAPTSVPTVDLFTSNEASDIPSLVPNNWQSEIPSDVPSSIPSDLPSDLPSSIPSGLSSDTPSWVPTVSRRFLR